MAKLQAMYLAAALASLTFGCGDVCRDGTFDNGTGCDTCRTCGPGEYEASTCMPDADRVCAAVSACAADQYEAAAPTATSDRRCAAVTACTADEYETAAPTATSDRQCAAVTACTADEYEAVAPTAISDRQCAALPSLTGLTLSAGALEPAAAPDVLAYTAAVGLFADSVTVTPTASSPDATITVNGTAVASAASLAIGLALGANTLTIEVRTADGLGARTYTVVVDRASAVLQQAYGKASNTGADDRLGHTIALDGDTLVVGAYLEDSSATGVNGTPDDAATDSGAVYVFTRAGTTWTQQAYLKASNTEAGDQFGIEVALSGDTLAVGALQEDSGATGVNGDQASNGLANSGAVYVFTRAGATWTQQAYLKASNPGVADFFGNSLALDGDTLAVGAYAEDSSATGVNGDQGNDAASSSGAVYVFTRAGTTWTQQAYLKASNADANDWFGAGLALSGDTLAVGAFGEASSATGVNGDQASDSVAYAGAAYVFTRAGTTWSQQAYLKASNTGLYDVFGANLALSGDTLAVGATGEDSAATGVNGNQADNTATDSGAVYVFTRTGATWTQQAYVKASNAGTSDQFGSSVALDASLLVVGARQEDSSATGLGGDQADNTAADAGAAYVFTRAGATWTQQTYLKASNTGAGDQLGVCVAVSGDTLAVGAPLEDSSATGIDGNQADNGAADSGAVYVFR